MSDFNGPIYRHRTSNEFYRNTNSSTLICYTNWTNMIWGIFKKFPRPSYSGHWYEVNHWDMTTLLPGYVPSPVWWTQPCSHFVSCYRAGNVTATHSVCATEEQRPVVSFLCSEYVQGTKIHTSLCAQYGDSALC